MSDDYSDLPAASQLKEGDCICVEVDGTKKTVPLSMLRMFLVGLFNPGVYEVPTITIGNDGRIKSIE